MTIMKKNFILAILASITMASVNVSCSSSDDTASDVQEGITTNSIKETLTSTSTWWFSPLSDVSKATFPEGYDITDFGLDAKYSITFKSDGTIEWYNYDGLKHGPSSTKSTGKYAIKDNLLTITSSNDPTDILVNTFKVVVTKHYIELHLESWNLVLALLPGVMSAE